MALQGMVWRASVRWLVTMLFAAMAGSALAQPIDGHDKQSDGRFTGIAMITDDLDWYDRFQRPEPPEISGRDRFEAGEAGSGEDDTCRPMGT